MAQDLPRKAEQLRRDIEGARRMRRYDLVDRFEAELVALSAAPTVYRGWAERESDAEWQDGLDGIENARYVR